MRFLIHPAHLASRPLWTLLLALVICATAFAAHAGPTLLLRQPALSRERMAFVYAGDIWLSNRDGSEPRQLTAQPASEFAPKFSPDGRWLAYSAGYESNIDVYVIAVEGGQPRRLSWHPAPDQVNGWSADGKRVLFASPREVANSRSNQLFEVPLGGGFERKLMQAVAFEGAWSADGSRLAYQPYRAANSDSAGWRRSRGGTTPPVWIIDPATQGVEKIPHVNATDRSPQWDGDRLYFISDRSDGAANVFAYDSGARSVRQLSTETTWDVRNFAVQDGVIVYEAGGALKELRVDGGATREIPVSINAPAPQARPQWKDAARTIVSAELSPSGKRVLVSARGEVFTVPVKDGSSRNLTRSAGVREKDALWSPDGKRIAWIADAGMRHVLQLRDQAGLEEPQSLALGDSGYFELLRWSPDGRRIVYHDNHLNLFVLDIQSGSSRLIASSARRTPFRIAFAPGGRWLAYTVSGANHFSQIKLHDFDTGRTEALTDGLSHADYPVFAAADYLFFTASINSGPVQVGLDMSTQERPLRSGIYAAVLAADGVSPLAPRTADEGNDEDDAKPESGEEEDEGESKSKSKRKPVQPVRIDLAGIQDRLVALPVPERNYDSLQLAHDGSLYYLERRQPGTSVEPPEAEAENNAELYRFDFKEREASSLARDLAGFGISADGKQLLLRYAKGKLKIAEAGAKLKSKKIDLSGLRMLVDPREEWRHIFEETCWMEQEFFYDPGMHGLDWQAMCARYRPLLAHVQRREDLNELLVDLIGELQVAHNNILGGDIYQEEAANTGLLGADFEIVDDRYRIRALYRGDRWNPFLQAPLAVPGLGIREDDFLLAVNGEQLDAARNLFQLLGNTAGKQVALTIAADASGKDSRTVTVVPVESEADLRRWQWIEQNRQYVQERSGGKVAYVYLPDTYDDGFRHFNRMFFSQIDKQAVIIDERRNGGGQAANYVVEVLGRQYLSGWKDRDGLVFSTPGGAIYGPKLMLIDQDAGSGGDFLPYAFKRLGLGTLLGTRTWGGLIGIAANPALIDGGTLTVPYFRFFTPEGAWAVENQGVSPDIEVELEPDAVNRGIDTQLDRAIAEVMRQLETYHPVERQSAPAMPTEPGH